MYEEANRGSKEPAGRFAAGDLFAVRGKTALVTGGSRGIGYMVAHGLVQNGVSTYITGRDAKACDAAAARLSSIGACVSVPADLSQLDELKTVAATLARTESRLNILVNNAGTTWGAPFSEFPAAGFDKVLNLNLRTPFLLTQSLHRLLQMGATSDDPSRVIMIGSVDGLRVPAYENFSYSASKAGLHMLARHLAVALAADNINVNTIAPGPFETKMMAHVLESPESRDRVESGVPRGRLGSAEDIVGAVLFLASRAGAYVTGAVIPVDGGIAARG